MFLSKDVLRIKSLWLLVHSNINKGKQRVFENNDDKISGIYSIAQLLKLFCNEICLTIFNFKQIHILKEFSQPDLLHNLKFKM